MVISNYDDDDDDDEIEIKYLAQGYKHTLGVAGFELTTLMG